MWIKDLQKGFRFGSLFLLTLAFFISGCQQQHDSAAEKVLTASFDSIGNAPGAISSTDSLPADSSASKTLRIIGVGDMMLGTNYPHTSYLPANGGKDLLADVLDTLKSADLTFGNLEGTILNSGGTPKRCKNPDLCYVFRSPENYVDHFVNAGFDVLSLANNHSGDFGPTGRTRTKAVLKESGPALCRPGRNG